MADLPYRPVRHDHRELIEKALKREGFREAYRGLEEEYALARELLAARARAGAPPKQVTGRPAGA